MDKDIGSPAAVVVPISSGKRKPIAEYVDDAGIFPL
tara:strand:+ start:473 stop:580 length:108 start_codon:yes stop_codon:yes gene_type:complete